MGSTPNIASVRPNSLRRPASIGPLAHWPLQLQLDPNHLCPLLHFPHLTPKLGATSLDVLMAAAAADFAASKRAMAYALCKHLSLDPVIPRLSSHKTVDFCSGRFEAKAFSCYCCCLVLSLCRLKADFLIFPC